MLSFDNIITLCKPDLYCPSLSVFYFCQLTHHLLCTLLNISFSNSFPTVNLNGCLANTSDQQAEQIHVFFSKCFQLFSYSGPPLILHMKISLLTVSNTTEPQKTVVQCQMWL